MIFIGIDIGADGAIAAITGNGLSFLRTKTSSTDSLLRFLQDFPPENTVAAYENLHAIWGASASATYGLGDASGWWRGVLDAFKYKTYKVGPLDWQTALTNRVQKPKLPSTKNLVGKARKAVLEQRRKINVAHRKNVKAETIRAANALFPGYSITHDGVADAVCIAAWLRLQFVNGDTNEKEVKEKGNERKL